jgi:hypothetical protein
MSPPWPDAGITAYHAVRKAVPSLYPGTTAVVQGAGGLGHIGIQALAAITGTRIIVVDRNPDALALAKQIGADDTVQADGNQVAAVQDLTNGKGGDVVFDFVAEQGAENDAWAMTAPGRVDVRPRLRRQGRDPRRSTSSAARRTSSATSSAPTTTSPTDGARQAGRSPCTPSSTRSMPRWTRSTISTQAGSAAARFWSRRRGVPPHVV